MLPTAVASHAMRITAGTSGDQIGYRNGIHGSVEPDMDSPYSLLYCAGGMIYGVYSVYTGGIYYLNLTFEDAPVPTLTRDLSLYVNGSKHTLSKAGDTNWQLVVGSHVFANGVTYGIRIV
jgi:hypothetical protein